jgi:hypothetical protein
MHHVGVDIAPSILDDTGGQHRLLMGYWIRDDLEAAAIRVNNWIAHPRIEFETTDLKRALDVVIKVLKEEEVPPASTIRVDYGEAYWLGDLV